MEEMSQEQPQFQNSVDVKLDYLQRDIREIKSDVKDIKSDFINRREFNEALTDVRKDVAFIQKIVYGAVGLICIGVIGGLLKLVIK